MKRPHNNRINSDWQFRCTPLPAGYAERYDKNSLAPPGCRRDQTRQQLEVGYLEEDF